MADALVVGWKGYEPLVEVGLNTLLIDLCDASTALLGYS